MKRRVTSEYIFFKKSNCNAKYNLDSEGQGDTSSRPGIKISKKKKNYKHFVNLRVTLYLTLFLIPILTITLPLV